MKNISLKIFFIFLTMTLSQIVIADRALPEFNANYAVKKYGTKLAEAHYQLEHTETGYKFTQKTKLHGLAKLLGKDTVSATSYIHQLGDTLLLHKHTYKQTGKEKNKDEKISIDWDTGDKKDKTTKGTINGTVRNKTITLQTNTPVWEALSFQIPLMIEADKDIKEYPYNAIIKGKIDSYNFVLTGIEKVYYANKTYQALHVVRTDPNKDRKLSIWLAPELHNLPLIIENYRNGKEHSRMQLENITFKNRKSLIGEASFDNISEDDDDF